MNLKLAATLAAFVLAGTSVRAEEGAKADEGAAWIAGIADETLTAVDDSTVTLSPMEGRLELDFAAHGGETQKTVFTFMSDRMGSVVSDEAGGKPNGFFRVTDVGLEIQYDDGNTAALFANVDDGLTMTRRGAGGATVCVSWYPKDHVFSEAERRAAVAAYAQKLGLHEDAPAPRKKPHAPRAVSACSPAMHAPKPVREASAVPAPAPTPASAPSVPATTVMIVVPTGRAAPDCLNLEVQGAYVGFHNRCGNEVQVAYCLEKAADPAIACGTGTRIGAVAPHGFTGTFEDTAAAEHDMRWIACSGSAGDVVPRLDRADPPAGACVKKSP
ncbi:MAG TPA: hypothetical protein VG889_20755 [Rhizomicrobium sp.]|nr:hypothetical protein [Rhizomicrobium sp.]